MEAHSALDLVKSKVESLLKTIPSGRDYFHALDDLIKYDDTIIKYMVDKYNAHDVVIVLSGQIGQYILNHIWSLGDKFYGKVILFRKSPRRNETVQFIPQFPLEKINSKATVFVMLDDTFYSGKTYFYIKGYLEALGYRLNKIFVAYNGSRDVLDYVESIYRYFDYHDKDGNKL